MKKIPTIFIRDKDNMRYVTDMCNPECLWVFKGEGIAIKKIDGTCCKVEGGELFKRREVKSHQVVPLNFVEEGYDPITEKRVGWVPVGTDSVDKYHVEAFQGQKDGTYELIGPKVQGNPEKVTMHLLINHRMLRKYPDCPRTFAELNEWLVDKDIEGVVFHHPDGRMGKIKKRDFGQSR